jgi:hypothetical protein
MVDLKVSIGGILSLITAEEFGCWFHGDAQTIRSRAGVFPTARGAVRL